MTKVSEGKTKSDWAAFIRQLEEEYAHAEEVTPAMDNLSTHKAGSLYEAFSPEEATHIRDRFEFLYTPKHGSWLNMVEIELNVLIGQCLNRRMDSLPQVETAVSAWQAHRDNLNAKVNWHFTTQDAPVKLPIFVRHWSSGATLAPLSAVTKCYETIKLCYESFGPG